MNLQNDKKPELLAPAGNLEAALTAFDYGADAVYAGLAKFNARERTDNFSVSDMSKLIEYARKIDKKVYITLNTLIKESEMKEVASLLSEISAMGPDAVIVQDLGVLRLIRDYFPNLPVHASTQMAIHNSAGINVARDLGIERVIMERQVTFEELETIVEKSPLEVEVFIHGALCCSLSGTCIFSSWLGGWSGNRGKCKQACRRRYFGKKGNGFFFSTKDLYSLEMISELKRIGVASLKIEGRLKKPDYVKNVVSAYRMMLDANNKDEEQVALKKGKDLLSKSLGRKWSEGFTSEESSNNLIEHKNMGVSGLLCGKIVGTEENGFYLTVSRRLHVGDRVRIQPNSGDEGPAMTITKMSINKKLVNKATKHQEVFIYSNKEIPRGSMLYKIGESFGDMSSRIEALPECRPSLDLEISVSSKGVHVKATNIVSPELWSENIEIGEAKKRPLDSETIKEVFAATCSNTFRSGSIQIKIEGELFLPASVLKQIRRTFWEWVDSNITPKDLIDFSGKLLYKFYSDYGENNHEVIPDAIEAIAVKPKGHTAAKKGHCVRSIYDYNKETDEVLLPLFCAEDRLESMQKRIDAAYKDGVRRFRVTSLYAIDMLMDYDDVSLIASYPFPVCNSLAAKELSDYNFTRVQAWVELEKHSIRKFIKKSAISVELYRYGRPALLVTRAKIPVVGPIHDSRKNNFVVIEDQRAGLTYLFAKDVMSIPRLPEAADYYDLTNAYWNEKGNSAFNFEHSFM